MGHGVKKWNRVLGLHVKLKSYIKSGALASHAHLFQECNLSSHNFYSSPFSNFKKYAYFLRSRTLKNEKDRTQTPPKNKADREIDALMEGSGSV